MDSIFPHVCTCSLKLINLKRFTKSGDTNDVSNINKMIILFYDDSVVSKLLIHNRCTDYFFMNMK